MTAEFDGLIAGRAASVRIRDVTLRRSIVLVAAAATAVFGCLASTVEAAAPARTQIVIFSPFTMFGQLARGVTITRTISGSCWIGSAATARPDAWRCMSGNEIHDPCYSNDAVKWVACPTASSMKVLRLRLTKPLPVDAANKPLNTKRSNPMQVVLTNGVTCGAPTGATGGEVASVHLSYLCSNGGALYGDPDRSTPTWSILYASSLSSSSATTAYVAVARW